MGDRFKPESVIGMGQNMQIGQLTMENDFLPTGM